MSSARIESKPGVMSGAPCIKGSRITVSVIHALLGRGMSPTEVARMYEIGLLDVYACMSEPRASRGDSKTGDE